MNYNNSKIRINDINSDHSEEKIENIKEKILLNPEQLENDSFFKKNIGSIEALFYVALPSFKSLLKNEVDKKIISLYLSQMTKFISLLEKENSNNNTNINEKNARVNDLSLLMDNVSAHILYEYFPEKRILMRYGDDGDKFYILLNGTIVIIVPRRKPVNISLNEYFRYIALLIIYKEQQLVKQVIRENKNNEMISIPGVDYFFTIQNDINPLILIKNIHMHMKYISELPNNSIKLKPKLSNVFDRYKRMSEKSKRKSSLKRYNYKDLENHYFKLQEFLYIYLTNEELEYYYNSLNDDNYDIYEIDDNKEVSPDIYVKRIQNYSFNINTINIKNLKNEEKINIINNEKKVLKLNIYEYNILLELNSGDIFGEAALSAPSLKRNATIMTVTQCHFGCLNRKIYQKHIQKATETNKKNLINYICSIGIFNGFPKDIMSKKYFPVFVFKKNKKNDLIIQQNQINDNIIIIKEGIYEIIFNGNMHDIYDLINIYYNKMISLKKINHEKDEEMHRKISKIKAQQKKIEKIFGNEMNKNEEYKILLIDSPSTFGLRETEEKKTFVVNSENSSQCYLSYYDLRCNSLKGEYISIDKNIFYKQMYGTEFCVQESTKIVSKQFIVKIINRLLNIYLSKIYNLLLNKGNNKDIETHQNNNHSHNHSHNKINKYNNYTNYTNGFHKKVNTLIDNCNETKFSSNDLDDYVFNYYEKKKAKNLKEKREFKNRKQKFKKTEIKRQILRDPKEHKDHSDLDYTTNTNTYTKNFSFTRISSALNISKLSFYLNKDKDKNNLRKIKNEIYRPIPIIKSRKSNTYINLSNSNYKSKLNLSPKVKKRFKVFSAKLYGEEEKENHFRNKLKTIKYDNFFKKDLSSSKNIKKIVQKFKKRKESKDNNINPKSNIISEKSVLNLSKILMNKSKSVYELKAKIRNNFIKKRSNYVINITRNFFTKQKDFNRKIRLKST